MRVFAKLHLLILTWQCHNDAVDMCADHFWM